LFVLLWLFWELLFTITDVLASKILLLLFYLTSGPERWGEEVLGASADVLSNFCLFASISWSVKLKGESVSFSKKWLLVFVFLMLPVWSKLDFSGEEGD